MAINSIDHVGIVVSDLPAAKEFFVRCGFELQWEGELEGEMVDRICGLDQVRSAVVFMSPPVGQTKLELIKFYQPTGVESDLQVASNTLGIRHIAFTVKDIDGVVQNLKEHGTELISDVQNYENIYKLCYIRGPEGIILELAEKLD